MFLYLGSKFISGSVKLPGYFTCRGVISLDKVKSKLPQEMYDFIITDKEEFISSFKFSEMDIAQAKFKKGNGNTWIFSSPCHLRFSEIKLPGLLSWRINLEKGDPIAVTACNDHDYHNHLASFYLSNLELLSYYDAIMHSGSANEQELITENFQLLKQIKDDSNFIAHENTIFHCTGHPFNCTSYKEPDWSVRLYYSIRGHLPDNVSLRLTTSTYEQKFASLQELFSSHSSPCFYIFRGIPDLIFSTKRVSVISATAAVHVYEEEYEFVEVKHGGRLPVLRDRPVNLPNAAAQVVGGLHFLATAKIVKGVMKGNIPTNFKVKGLLLKHKDQMTLYSLNVNVASVCSTVLTICYQDLHMYGSASFTMAHLCSGVKKLVLE